MCLSASRSTNCTGVILCEKLARGFMMYGVSGNKNLPSGIPFKVVGILVNK